MNIAVIGSGTMGMGIAQVAASNNCIVWVIDTNKEVLEKAKLALTNSLQKLVDKNKIAASAKESILQNIHFETDSTCLLLHTITLVIEAIVENIAIKKTVFASLENNISEHCILASNTSSLSITSIASACKYPERVIGIHFFNPATLMALVEIIPAIQTSQKTIDAAKSIIDSWSKITVLAKDTPGFIVNRIARPYYSEALRIADEGIATVEEIDFSLKNKGAFKMGPFELMDMIGHDVNYAVTESVWSAFYFDTKYTPSFTQKRLVEANWLGKKTGRGFYNYTQNEVQKNTCIVEEKKQEYIVERVVAMLINEAANTLQHNVANKEDIENAMLKGVNYPKGLLAWADAWGIEKVVLVLDTLYNHYHEDRYRCCSLLRIMLAKNETFYT